MAGILPEEIRWRVGKVDFRPSIDYAILNINSPLLDRMFRDCSRYLGDYVNREALNRVYHDFLADPSGQDPTYLLVALSLGLWLGRSGLEP